MNKRITQILEHLGFITLGVMSILFAEERLLADSCYYFIRVINSGSFWIEHSRLILILPELAPLIGSILKLELKSLVYLYSIGHVVFFYSIYIICRYRYQNTTAGPILLLFQTLGIQEGFFVPMFELYYAAALLVLLISILSRGQLATRSYILITVLSIFISSAHMFAIMLLLFLFVWRSTDRALKRWKEYTLVFICVGGFSVYKKSHITEYEQGKMDAFLDGLKTYTPDLNYLQNLSSFLTTHYLELLLMAAMSLGLLLWQKKYWRLLIYLSSFTALLAMVTIAYRGFEPSRYQEQVYFPVSFVVAWVFVESSNSVLNRRIKVVLFAIGVSVFVIRTVGINEAAKWFTGRQNELRSLISVAQEKEGTKFFIHESELNHDPNWSYSIESLILSSIENDKTVTICTNIDIEHGSNSTSLESNQFLFRRWELYDQSVLNPTYFRLDNSDYQQLQKPDN